MTYKYTDGLKRGEVRMVLNDFCKKIKNIKTFFLMCLVKSSLRQLQSDFYIINGPNIYNII